MRYKMRYYDFSHNMLLRASAEVSMDKGAYVRVLHAATKAPNVDVYVNDKLTIPDLRYREFTDYIKLQPGTYNIKVYPINDKTKAVINSDVKIEPNTVTTLVAYSQDRNLSILPIKETPLQFPTEKKAKIRISHLIENIPPVDIYLSDGTLLYKNVNFKDLTKYIELPPNNYIIDMKLTDTDISMLYVPNINLNGENYYTLYLIGLVNDYPGPQMLIPLDGITYLNL